MSLFSNESSSDGLGTYFKKWRAFQPCPAITQNKKGSADFVEICKKKHRQGYQLVLIFFKEPWKMYWTHKQFFLINLR